MLIQDIKPPQTKRSIAGRVVRDKVAVRIIFIVNGTEYQATPHNRELIDSYLHTGNPAWLKQLEVGSE